MTFGSTVDNVSLLVEHIEAAPDIDILRKLNPGFNAVDRSLTTAIFEEVSKFCESEMEPLNTLGDTQGCSFENGRVRMPAAFQKSWKAFVAAGWPGLDQPIDRGGQGLPLFMSVGAQQLIDSACVALGMLPVLLRSAATLLSQYGDDWMQQVWVPRLVSGEWGATICISESDAGSDVGAMRTRAEINDDGSWSITGEKMWISFGDHDLTERIGHCLLAKTAAGGLSLFLVPNYYDDAHGKEHQNSVYVRRIEEKLGLHGSPTCAMGFEKAKGWLIGAEGRGLSQMFAMITKMRLSAGIQGLSQGSLAADVALQYARERRQGGNPPVAIFQHADIQRELLEMISQLEVLRGLGFAIAIQADLATFDADAENRQKSSSLLQWLLPIFKTLGGQAGFDLSNKAIQILGGAGYTRDWPVEQALRDSRIFTIYEGTSGIQALDLVHRRLWREGAVGMQTFISRAEADLSVCEDSHQKGMERCLELLKDAANFMQQKQNQPREAEAGASAFLQLAGLAATGWIATRLTTLDPKNPSVLRMAAAGAYWLNDLEERATLVHSLAVRGAERLKFSDVL